MRKKRKNRRPRAPRIDHDLQAALAYASREEIARVINDYIEAGALKAVALWSECPNCGRKFYRGDICPYCEQDINDPVLRKEKYPEEPTEAEYERPAEKEESGNE